MIEQAIMRLEGAVQALSAKPDGTAKKHESERNALDSKVIMNLKSMGTKGNVREWNEELINALAITIKGSRDCMKKIMSNLDQGSQDPLEEQEWNQEFKEQGIQWKQFNESLYCILVDKCEEEALTRVRSVGQGQGIQAYSEVYKWFSGITGITVAARIGKIMTPAAPKKDEELADAIDRWQESQRQLQEMDPEYGLMPVFKISALKQLMSVRGKEYFENLESQYVGKASEKQFEEMLRKCKELATRRRLESSRKKTEDKMECDEVEESWDEHWDYEEDEWIAVLSKGKGGKGKGKGKGKAGFQ
jgi:hypothetical protein